MQKIHNHYGIQCPFCNYVEEDTDDLGLDTEGDIIDEYECENCGNAMRVTLDTTHAFISESLLD